MLLSKADRIDDASRWNLMGRWWSSLNWSWCGKAMIWRSELQRVLDLIFPSFQPQQIVKSLSASRSTFGSVVFVAIHSRDARGGSKFICLIKCCNHPEIIVRDHRSPTRLYFSFILAYRPPRIHVHQLWSRQMLMVNWDIARKKNCLLGPLALVALSREPLEISAEWFDSSIGICYRLIHNGGDESRSALRQSIDDF